MIDLHNHILPGIDDGSKDLEQSLAMARLAIADGIHTLTATPHHLNGIYSNPAEAIRQRVRSFNLILRRENIALTVLPGSELHLVPEVVEQLHAGLALTIADQGKAALIELPVHTVPLGTETLLEDMLAMDIQPLIAHPERNGELGRHPERLARWVDMGCVAQITGQSCSGRFGPEIRRISETMVRMGLIHVLASDAHRDQRRIPELSSGRAEVERWVGAESARLMTEDHPLELIQGRYLDSDAMRELLPKARRWKFW